MKKNVLTILGTSTILFSAAYALAGDIPCDKLGEKIEFYQCKQVRREFKVGIKKNDGFFCAEHKKIVPVDGCAIKGFDGVKNDKVGDEAVQATYIYALIPASVSRDQTDKFRWQCEPRVNHAGINTASSIGKMIPGFTVTEQVGKDNATRDGMWQDDLKKNGKRLLGTWTSSAHFQGSNVIQQRCILYNEATNTMLVDMYGDIQPYQGGAQAPAKKDSVPEQKTSPAGGLFKGLFR